VITGDLYRSAKRDRHGDPVDDDGNPVDLLDPDGLAFVGTIEDIVMGGLSSNSLNVRGEVASTDGMIGCPRAGIKLQHGDRIDIDSVRYQVVGPRLWDYPSALTGTDFTRYWVRVDAVLN
jgi:hypothetical protein